MTPDEPNGLVPAPSEDQNLPAHKTGRSTDSASGKSKSGPKKTPSGSGKRPPRDAEARMTFTEHLAELRIRIIRSGVALLVSVVVCYAFSNTIFEIVASPLAPLQQAADEAAAEAALQTEDEAAVNETAVDETTIDKEEPDQAAKPVWRAFNILEPILVKLKLAVYAGILLALPVIIHQACSFVFPGLKPTERKAVRILLTGGTCLAISGMAVAYFGVFRFVLPYLMEWAPPGVVIDLRMNENVSLIIKGLLGFAIAFQFPMAVLILVYLDLLSPETLKKHRRVAIVGMAVVAALFTPPDPGTMLIMLAPLVILYEGSIWMSYLVIRRRKKAQEA